MNRSNIGNVITNGMQILSVGATTGGAYSRRLGRADDALNNKELKSSPDSLGYNSKIYQEESTSGGVINTNFNDKLNPIGLKDTNFDFALPVKDLPTEQAPKILEYIMNNYKYNKER